MGKLKKEIFRGAATALITPFRDGQIDYDALSAIISTQLSGGISALVVAGTTGEASTLSYAEHAGLVAFVVKEVKGKIPVIAGCGSNSTQNAVVLARGAADAGADCLLSVTPYYNKASDVGLVAHFHTVADSTDLPLLLYNVPSRTGLNLTPALAARLSEHDRIIGIKEASGNISVCADILASSRLALYSGNDDMTLPTLALGGSGVISVVSNIFPATVSRLCREFDDGNIRIAANIQLGMCELCHALFSEVNPIPVKTAMAALGLCREEFRLPLAPMDPSKKAILLDILKNRYGRL